MKVSLHSDSIETTHELGRVIGSNVCPGDILLLSGGLGAGKTTLTQGILWGLGSDEYARSPTFVLVNEYEARIPVYHMDLYRLDSFEEIDGLGLEDYLFGDGLCVIEWADKAQGYFPVGHVAISIETVSEDARVFTLDADPNSRTPLFSALRDLKECISGK
ncbi:MAG: tRNA (adenosine(37)-N6)-threonylcarbamoyltransferase complex ATPase subunit type 1 TsaE [Dehalococcoidia bacterium]|nr:tRNA (adenosine(37)-N6)-threonylcarbamoyltransferase complex ATPase subunit type 1 TsaE [Dehalococcoidia bacterium]